VKSKRRRFAQIGAILFAAAFAGFLALFLIYVPLSGGGGGVLVLGIPDMVAAAIGTWLLTWTGLFWSEKQPSPSNLPQFGN
jgi:hypothetical protein